MAEAFEEVLLILKYEVKVKECLDIFSAGSEEP